MFKKNLQNGYIYHKNLNSPFHYTFNGKVFGLRTSNLASLKIDYRQIKKIKFKLI